MRNVTIAFSEFEQPLVHVDVEDLRAVLHLGARHRERGLIVARLDQLAKLRRPRDVGPLADIDERRRRAVVCHCVLPART